MLEYALGGELFFYVKNSGYFPEKTARFYFRQMIEALAYVHGNGLAHRDLKPDNLLFDGDFNLKIADFGFAGPIQGRDGKGYLTTRLGTANYMAPEIHDEKPYSGASVDLYAAAIILFIMCSSLPPFMQAKRSDTYFR